MASDIVTAAVVQIGRAAGVSGNGQVQSQLGREGTGEGGIGSAANRPVKRAQLEQTVADLNAAAKIHRRSLRFSVDEGSGRTVIRVVDPSTDEVIRQIPPEEVLDLAKHLSNSAGALLRAEA